MRRGKNGHFPSFHLILEIFVAPNVPGQVVDAELRADTVKFRSVALCREGGGLCVRSLCPFAVLMAHVFGRVLLEHDNVLIGGGLAGDFRHGWEFFSLQRSGFMKRKFYVRSGA